jgi:hypothetical protein
VLRTEQTTITILIGLKSSVVIGRNPDRTVGEEATVDAVT